MSVAQIPSTGAEIVTPKEALPQLKPPAAEDNLTIRVYRNIRDMMLNYEIVPGQRLIFADLARRLRVSRTPVNNALSLLAKEGFLDFTPNQGYTVHRVTRQEAESLYEMLKIITVGAIGRTIQQLTPAKLTTLHACKQAYQDAVKTEGIRKRFLLDQEYHATIIRISGIHGLDDCFRDIYQQIYLRLSIESLETSRARAVLQEHQQIYDAIALGDVAETRKLVEDHLDAGMQYIVATHFNANS